MTKTPYPILKWRDAREKEWTFRALHALGFMRDRMNDSADEAWATLSHNERFDGIGIDISSGNHIIRFGYGRSSSSYTLVNSGPHLISYIKRHGMAPKRDA